MSPQLRDLAAGINAAFHLILITALVLYLGSASLDNPRPREVHIHMTP